MIEKNTTSSGITELYIATFNRAPDSAGLAYWTDAVDQGGWRIDDVAVSFFDQPETISKYPPSMSTNDFIDAIYNNVLNRNADADGKSYWTKQIESGAITKDNFILAMINGAKNGGTDADKTLLQNKHDVGQYFAIDLELNDLSLSKRIMEDINETTVSRDRAISTLDLFKAAVDLNYMELDDTDNTLVLVDSNDWIYALGGNDTIQASTSTGIKWVHGGTGADMLYGGTQNDTFHGGQGDDTIYGNGGADTFYGDDGNDSIHGDEDGDLIYGDGGDDVLYGDAGDDKLYGGQGNDTLNGGEGDDTLYGGAGNDLIDGNEGIAFIDGGAGDDILHGGSSDDTIYCGEDNDTAYGRDGNDHIDGMKGNDTLYGGAGTDYLNGNSESDSLYGGSGDDTLLGESGADQLHGDTGSDTLSGGTGSDTFIFQTGDSDLLGYDIISDFTLDDKLSLVNKGVEILNNTTLNVSSALTLNDAANIAAAGDASVNAIVSWFVYDQDTYLVEDMNAGATFVDGSDLIVKLQGVIALDGELINIVLFS